MSRKKTKEGARKGLKHERRNGLKPRNGKWAAGMGWLYAQGLESNGNELGEWLICEIPGLEAGKETRACGRSL